MRPRVGVGFRVVTVVDAAAGTPARGPSPARRVRVLRTSVWYPEVGGAAPARGRFPLVVFAHGYDVIPATYAPLLREVAAAGFVVAAPLFPISGAGLPGQPREDDMPAQALDLRAVTSSLLAAARGHGWLAGAVDPAAVAYVGHSDGGETVAATLLVPKDRDPRVRAAVVLGGQLPTWGMLHAVAVPSLVVQGSADTVNPPSLSQDLYRRLQQPKLYLDVIGGGHLPAVVGADRRARAVRAAVVAFLQATLRGSASAARRLRRIGDDPGLTQLTGGI